MASEQGKDYGPSAQDVRAEGANACADIETVLGKPKTPDDLIEDARWWLRELGDAHPDASPCFKALVQVVRENDRLSLHANASRPEGAPTPAPTPAQSRGTE